MVLLKTVPVLGWSNIKDIEQVKVRLNCLDLFAVPNDVDV